MWRTWTGFTTGMRPLSQCSCCPSGLLASSGALMDSLLVGNCFCGFHLQLFQICWIEKREGLLIFLCICNGFFVELSKRITSCLAWNTVLWQAIFPLCQWLNIKVFLSVITTNYYYSNRLFSLTRGSWLLPGILGLYHNGETSVSLCPLAMAANQMNMLEYNSHANLLEKRLLSQPMVRFLCKETARRLKEILEFRHTEIIHKLIFWKWTVLIWKADFTLIYKWKFFDLPEMVFSYNKLDL